MPVGFDGLAEQAHEVSVIVFGKIGDRHEPGYGDETRQRIASANAIYDGLIGTASGNRSTVCRTRMGLLYFLLNYNDA